MLNCRDDPTDYGDAALPLSEQLCRRAIREHTPHARDPYNQSYIDVSYHIDDLLSDPFSHRVEALDAQFRTFQTRLEKMIQSPELTEGSKGRFLYHINARILQAYLGPLRFRAEHRTTDVVPVDLLEATRNALGNLLKDFSSDGLYNDVAQQVALKRTEVEIPLLLLRTRDPQSFIWPALCREEAGNDQVYNHDFYSIYRTETGESRKVPIQVKTNDYSGRGKSRDYSAETMMVIHQQIVNMDVREQVRLVTRVDGGAITPEEELVDEPYEKFDTDRQYVVVWGAGATTDGKPEESFEAEFVQLIGGNKRDGLMEAMLGELSGRHLSIDERNILNGATHFLTATLRESKQQL